MICRSLFFGVSLFVLGTGTAVAQSQNVNDVTQTGSGNTAAVDNSRPGNSGNRSTVVQNGNRNSASILQIGTTNLSRATELGSDNRVLHTQEGDFHQAVTSQSGDASSSAARQRGQFNSVTVTQNGDRNSSRIAQGIEVSDGDFLNPAAPVATRAGNDNRATVTQIGNDLGSIIRQRSGSGSRPSASNNSASVQQRGLANSSTILQDSRGNSATVLQFEGGAQTLRNVTLISQGNSAATQANNPLSNNRANVSVAGQRNSSTISQDGLNNYAEVTQGFGQSLVTAITQVGAGTSTSARVAQYGDASSITIGQNSIGARADVWQQAGPAGGRSANNGVEVQQGTGTTGTAAFSSGFFNNVAPTGAGTIDLLADVIQGNGSAAASWNRTEIRQDGVGLTANVRQAGVGSASLPNLARIAQQRENNSATIIQGAGVGPSTAGDPASGLASDEFSFAGGARSAEAIILQSGGLNSAIIEQRGRGQFARIEQGPGAGNVGTILQEATATNATAVLRQTGNDNSYNIVQDAAGQYILVSQTGNNNVITTIVQRP